MNKIQKECFLEVKNWIDYLADCSDASYDDFGMITIKEAIDSMPSSSPNKKRLTEYVNSLSVQEYDHLTERFSKRFDILTQRIYKDLT